MDGLSAQPAQDEKRRGPARLFVRAHKWGAFLLVTLLAAQQEE